MTEIKEFTYTGKLNLILGCMFSGKTSELISRYNRYTIGNKKCIMIKYKNDTRYDDKMIVTHDNIKVDAVVCDKLVEVDDLHIVSDYDVICVDEVQFYTDAPVYIEKWANLGKIVEACGLNGTYDRKPFPVISNLIPMAENISFLTAICRETGELASYSKLTVVDKRNHNENDDSTNERIGGAESYSAVDRLTYFKKI